MAHIEETESAQSFLSPVLALGDDERTAPWEIFLHGSEAQGSSSTPSFLGLRGLPSAVPRRTAASRPVSTRSSADPFN